MAFTFLLQKRLVTEDTLNFRTNSLPLPNLFSPFSLRLFPVTLEKEFYWHVCWLVPKMRTRVMGDRCFVQMGPVTSIEKLFRFTIRRQVGKFVRETSIRGPQCLSWGRGTSMNPKGHTSGIASVGFLPDGTRLVSGSWDKTVRVGGART